MGLTHTWGTTSKFNVLCWLWWERPQTPPRAWLKRSNGKAGTGLLTWPSRANAAKADDLVAWSYTIKTLSVADRKTNRKREFPITRFLFCWWQYSGGDWLNATQLPSLFVLPPLPLAIYRHMESYVTEIPLGTWRTPRSFHCVSQNQRVKHLHKEPGWVPGSWLPDSEVESKNRDSNRPHLRPVVVGRTESIYSLGLGQTCLALRLLWFECMSSLLLYDKIK